MSWMCKNPKCGLWFQWDRTLNIAVYNRGEEDVNKYVPGDTRPSGCPECGQDEVEALDG